LSDHAAALTGKAVAAELYVTHGKITATMI